jgi:hypothetical protein
MVAALGRGVHATADDTMAEAMDSVVNGVDSRRRGGT